VKTGWPESTFPISEKLACQGNRFSNGAMIWLNNEDLKRAATVGRPYGNHPARPYSSLGEEGRGH